LVKVGQAWLSLGEFMLDAPDDFLVLHVPGNYFQGSCSIPFPGTEVRLIIL